MNTTMEYMPLPEQQTFPMLFYRKDILIEIGLTPPQTWQDVYNMISVLQKHNMEFFLPIEDANKQLKSYSECNLFYAALSEWRKVLFG